MLFLAVSQLKAQRKEDIGKEREVSPQQTEIGIERSSNIFARRGNSSVGGSSNFLYTSTSKKVKKRLEINKEDYLNYKSFLEIPNTGIVKILAQSECADRKTRAQCWRTNAEIDAFAGSYSFAKRQYTFASRADFSVVDNNLEATRTEIQTIIVDLGNAPLETLTLESKGVGYLKKINPFSQVAQAQKQYNDFLKGIFFEHFNYSKSALVKLNNAYAVRSIDYAHSSAAEKENFDTIIVFKVVRLEKDGSITLLWKELSRNNSPILLNKK